MAWILIADDSAISCRIIKTIIEKKGHTTTCVADGELALAELSGNKFDAAIIDLLMPVKDGFDVLKEVNKQKIDIPIIILTADIQESTRIKCIELGARSFIKKPINETLLIETLNGILVK
jgi:two-component system, chemotaxis family, chemotaxis protein CheY